MSLFKRKSAEPVLLGRAVTYVKGPGMAVAEWQAGDLDKPLIKDQVRAFSCLSAWAHLLSFALAQRPALLPVLREDLDRANGEVDAAPDWESVRITTSHIDGMADTAYVLRGDLMLHPDNTCIGTWISEGGGGNVLAPARVALAALYEQGARTASDPFLSSIMLMEMNMLGVVLDKEPSSFATALDAQVTASRIYYASVEMVGDQLSQN